MRTGNASSAAVLVLLAAGAASAQCGHGFNFNSGSGHLIPDLGMLARPLVCNSYGTAGSMRIQMRIVHGRPGDLVIRLRHDASGRVATLMDRPGTEDGQSTVGYTAANLGDRQLAGAGWFIFDDAAPGPYAVPLVGIYPRPGVEGIHGSFRPTVDLFSTFAGLPLASPWTLEILDEAEGVAGELIGLIIMWEPAEPPTCYPNCDHSGTTPFLNVADFACFLNAYAEDSSYANCDGSSTPPVLNVADFACFLNQFAAGCSAP